MAERNLPIKFFKKRTKDEQLTEGGGKETMQPWMLTGVALARRSRYLRRELSVISDKLTSKVSRQNFIPSVMLLKLHGDASAKTHRRHVSNLFNTGKLNLIGVSGGEELLVKVDSVKDLNAIISNLEKAEDNIPTRSAVVGVSAVTDIEEYKPVVDVKPKKNDVLKVKLFNFHNSDIDSILTHNFESFCESLNLSFERASYSGDLNIYRLSGVTKDSMEELKAFDGIQVITAMPFFELTTDAIDLTDTVAMKNPKPGVQYPVIGVLDTGIADIPHLKPWLEPSNITYYADDDVDKSHGTFVAGVLLYGDELDQEDHTGFDGCRLFEAIVMPDLTKQRIHEDVLVEQIRDAVSRHDSIKVWNLSLGTNSEADLDEFSDFAAALDDIQEEYEVLICKSAGNCDNFKIRGPKSRISRSAETVRGLVVGSIGHDRLPSSFSRKGPGPAHIIKPDVVHIGGAATLDTRNRLSVVPVRSFSPTGKLVSQVGTSFSTPRIASIAAGLHSILNETFNPLLLKALIIHSAKYPEQMKLTMIDKIHTSGFGMPKNIQEILFNEPNEITLILHDTIERSNFIDVLDFPFPQSMVDDQGNYYGEITVTLATAPMLDVSQGREYCQSNIDVKFGTYDKKTERDTTKANIKNPIGADGRQNLLYPPLYNKKVGKKLDHPFASERILVSYGDKFHPVKKWCVNLDEFTPTNSDKYLQAPKNWYLKLEGLFRHHTEDKCGRQNIIPSQEFCLIVTIRDTKKKGKIYNEVSRMLDQFSFVHSNVKIRNEVKLRLDGKDQ